MSSSGYSSYQRRSFQGRVQNLNNNKYPYDLTLNYDNNSNLNSTSPLNRNSYNPTREGNSNQNLSKNYNSNNRHSTNQKHYEYDIGDAPARARTPHNKSVNIQNVLNDYSLSKQNTYSRGDVISTSKNCNTYNNSHNVSHHDSYSKYQKGNLANQQIPYSSFNNKNYNHNNNNNKRVYINDTGMEHISYGKFYDSKNRSHKRQSASKKYDPVCFDQDKYQKSKNKYENKQNSMLNSAKQKGSKRDYQTKYQYQQQSNDISYSSSTLKENNFFQNRQKSKSYQNKTNSNNSNNNSYKNPQQERRNTQNQREIMKKINRINSLNQEINNRLQKMIAKMGQK